MSSQLFNTPGADQFGFASDDNDGESLADRYQMLEELGSGSFGVVYKAIEKETGEIVAVKHVDLESSEEDLSDILSELSVLSSCSSQHVTKYKLAFLRRQTLWIVMEYLGGGSCADLLKPPPHALTEQHIAIIMRELLLGLSYLHSEGKLHRDIKAANVLLGMDGRVKLADFGVAAQLVGLKSVRNTFVGTPFWMAPEVIQQEGHDSKADVWSLGITAMELANGQPPHANVHPMKVLFLIPKQSAPRLEGSTWSRDFREFVALCLTKDVERRPTAKELLKHRFIRSAGKIENLQELIMRKQEYDSAKGAERNFKYYAETMRNLPAAQKDDEWVFETVKAVPTMDLRGKQTQKRRKVASVDLDADALSATTLMEDLTLEKVSERPKPVRRTSKTDAVADEDTPLKSSTMRRVKDEEFFTPQQQRPEEPTPSPSVRRRSTKKRVSSTQFRQPLGVNISFGNSPSTVRQFRRVSPNVVDEKPRAGSPTPDAENIDPIQERMVKKQPISGSTSPTKPSSEPNTNALIPSNPFPASSNDTQQPSSTSTTSSSPSKPPPPQSTTTSSSPSKFSSRASTLAPHTTSSSTTTTSPSHTSKDAHLGSLLYTRAIGLSCQTVLDSTASPSRREAVSRLAEAFSDIEDRDPEGLHAIMKEVIMRMVGEKELRDMLPRIEVTNLGQGGRTGMGTISMTKGGMGTTRIAQQGGREMGTVNKVLGADVMGEETRQQEIKKAKAEQQQEKSTTDLAVKGLPTRMSTEQQKVSASAAAAVAAAQAGLKMAANNPHLKSHHKRRQSEQVSHINGRSRQASPRSNDSSGFLAIEGVLKEETHLAERNEERSYHKQLADVLFEKWCDGLRVRWPGL